MSALARLERGWDAAVNAALLIIVIVVLSRWAESRGAVWQPVLTAIIVSAVINLTALAVTLVRRDWPAVRLAGRVLAGLVNMAGLSAGLEATGPDEAGIRLVLGFFLVIVAFAFIMAAWKLVRLIAARGGLRGASPGETGPPKPR